MRPFVPENLPLENLDWGKLINNISIANREIARYDGLLQSIPEPMVLLSPLRTKEAVLSSKIEGTQATLEEVLEFDALEDEKIDSQKNLEIFEIINYRKALNYAVEMMESHPITLNMLKRIHEILMHDVRGSNRDPGNFRRIQNWIGRPGSTMENARFVPPSPNNLMQHLGNLESYFHLKDIDPLVQMAIVHAQFEIIHPFLDGNGRIGRILVPLFLYNHEIIHQPAFYLSSYLEKNRQEYYDSLKSITDNKDWSIWINFFLNAITEQAKENSNKIRLILDLYNDMKITITDLTHSQFSIKVIDLLFSSPIFNSTRFAKQSSIPRASANRILGTLVENDIIRISKKGVGRKPTIYRFHKLFEIINSNY